MSIMNYFPYDEAYPEQEEILLDIEKSWASHDVIVLTAPTGAGKTAIAKTIQDWNLDHNESCAFIVPNNQLRDQAMAEFDDLVTVKAQQDYWLEDHQMTEKEYRRRIYKYGPKDSQYEKDRRTVKRVGTKVIANYYTMMAHKLQRKTLIVDEAHCLLKTLQDLHAKKIWKHEFKYPTDMETPADVLAWIESRGTVNGILGKLRNEIKSLTPATIIEQSTDLYRGEEKDCLKLIPLDVSNEAPTFWPSKTQTVVLMSASISALDIQAMGLSRKKVKYIDMKSCIPVENRPVKWTPIADMRFKLKAESMPTIADALQQLAASHPEKGLIHATYETAVELRKLLKGNNRFVFHNQFNKAKIYDAFYNSDPSEGRILVGSGMSEGLDLKHDAARWQAVLKCPYPNITSPAMRWLMRHKPEEYQWLTSKEILQCSGRICRGPQDFGVTYLLDNAFGDWYKNNRETLPTWFQVEGVKT